METEGIPYVHSSIPQESKFALSIALPPWDYELLL